MICNFDHVHKPAQPGRRRRRAAIDALEPRLLFTGGQPIFQALATAPIITSSGVASTPVVVQFFEPTVNPATFSNSNFIADCVAGPSLNASVPVTYVGLDPHDPGAGHGLRIADYRVDAPGGAWTAADDGVWSIVAVGNQVNDSTYGFLGPGSIGQFQIVIPAPAPMTVSTGGATLSSGQSVDLGSTTAGVQSTPRSFTITNTGSQTLVATVRIGQGVDGARILAGASLPNGSMATWIAAGGSSTFTLAIDSTVVGAVNDPVDIYASPFSGDVPFGDFSFNVTSAVGAVSSTPTAVSNGVAPSKAPSPALAPRPSAATPAAADPQTSPLISAINVPPVITAGATTSSFGVSYSDKQPDVTTFGNANLLVAGPGGYLVAASYTGLDPAAGGAAGAATRSGDYVINAPAGGWSLADNGVYTVILQPNQVRDVVDGAFPAGAIGQFTVNLPAPAPFTVAVDGKSFAANQTINFGSQTLPLPGQTHAITFTNTGTEPLIITLNAANAADNLGITGFPENNIPTYFWKAPNSWNVSGGLEPPLLPGQSETDFVTLDPGAGTVAGPASLAAAITATSLVNPSETFSSFGVNLAGVVQTTYPTDSIYQVKHQPILFINSAGKLTKVRLIGPGTLQVNFNAINYQYQNRGQVEVPEGDPTSVVLTGTTRGSTLQVAGRGAYTISNVIDSAPLGHFLAPNATLLGVFSVKGNVTSLAVRALDASFTANIAGALKTLLIYGQGSGTLAAGSIGTIHAASLSGARYLVGANFGADGIPGNGDDSGVPSTIGTVYVGGNVSDSLIAAGLVPADGSFFAGADALTGTAANDRIGIVTIRGKLDSASRILAEAYGRVRIAGVIVHPKGDPRFTADATV